MTSGVQPATRRINRGSGHSYLLDGAPVQSVTKALSEGYPKPGLIGWAFDTASKFAVDHWDELAELGAGSRLTRIQKARYTERDEAAARGTAIHELAHKLQAGETLEIPEPLVGHVDAYLRFVKDWQPREILVETSVFSREFRYAGTVDLIADLRDGRRWLLDWKTSKGEPYPEAALQLAAYRYADFHLHKDGVTEVPMPRVERTGIVWLRADGYDLIPVDAGPEAFTAFGHVQQVAAFRDEPRERWIGQTLPPPTEEEAA
jgi:hypothetical protein